jgi:hypothetical protein
MPEPSALNPLSSLLITEPPVSRNVAVRIRDGMSTGQLISYYIGWTPSGGLSSLEVALRLPNPRTDCPACLPYQKGPFLRLIHMYRFWLVWCQYS